MKTKLILLERKRPTVFEVHVGKISQANNLLFSTKDKELADNIVKSFNKYDGLKKKLETAKNDLGIQNIFLAEVSKAYKKNMSKANQKVSELKKRKKQK